MTQESDPGKVLHLVEELNDALRNNVAMLARTLRWEREAIRLRQLIDAVRIPLATSQLASLDAAGESPFLKRA